MSKPKIPEKEIENGKEVEELNDKEKNNEIIEELPKNKDPVEATLNSEFVIAESNDLTRELYDKTRYGEPLDNKKFQYSLIEALYLMERGKFKILDSKKKEIEFDIFVKKAKKTEPNFWIRYVVFKDLRKRGYVVKTALKFGADFRVYDRGIKPGEDHAKWIVYPVHEASAMTWFEFSAKNRVAHSTRKRLLLGIVDAENDVTFYEVRWMRP
ncbi:tRNA-intron lyase [Candidatus Woesearchaeota archaeon]|nr:tRNA-intron lyase [Candidatus Woesearchaeota archaeon]